MSCPPVTTGNPAYALFGVSDFDGDCGPTSARITMHSNTGEYYVGYIVERAPRYYGDFMELTPEPIRGSCYLDSTVGLIANTTGEYSRLEWSNFGDWEELPVPDCLEHMMSPEVVCGPDGRWHIIYRDWVNDNIMCLSTE